MNWQKKLAKLFSLIFLSFAVASCDGNYCVEADEFDNDYVQVKANPISDGVFGTIYNHNDGGQTATWHETGLRANGKPFLIQVSGAWIPWYGSAMTDSKLNAVSRCNFCAKKNNVANENCICYNGQTPKSEKGIGGMPIVVPESDCVNNPTLQNDPSRCTCTTLNGRTTDEGVFHFPLNFYNKDHSIKFPDDQGSACKYNGGMGLYLGLFGTSSNEMPIRVYHLFSEATTCAINRNSNNECKDENGVDQTKYVFRSANNAIFVKDDASDNIGINATTADDIYHKPNEFVKLMIHDRYYSDNYGKYSVTILEGVSRDGDTGLLEFLVEIVEEALLGKRDINGVKKGGVLEYMYKAIVQDSYFGATLQICLSLYIAFFGFATLIGIVEITKKELLSRLVKLSLVIFFTTPTSWYWYNQLIVMFFKEGMDVIITMFSDFVNANIQESNPIRIAQSISTNPDGGASRFSYIDTMIKTLYSSNVAKKIWGLFFQSFFGFIYILAIYALMLFFIYVMLLAAMTYMVTLMKLIFVLALGPIFITFSLFGQTNAMFKNWLSFIGARSLEMVMLFLILYTFVMFIDEKFTGLLRYRVCTESINFGRLSFIILKADVNRGIVEWFGLMLTLAALIYILMEIVKKIPEVAGQLISIGGVDQSNDGAGNSASSFGMAGKMLSAASGLAMAGAKAGLSKGGGAAFRAIRVGSRAIGASAAIDKVGGIIPFRGVRARLRDNLIDSNIEKGKAFAASQGLKPGTKQYDLAVRGYVMGGDGNNKETGLGAFKHQNKAQAALYDMTAENIAKRLDQKLVKEPLKEFLKDKAKELKKGDPDTIPLGKDMEKQLKEAARTWAEKNLVGGQESVNGHLKDLKGFMKKHGKLSDDEAAKKFAGNQDLKDKFLQYKQERALAKNKSANTNTGKNFMRKVGYEEKRNDSWLNAAGAHTGKGWDPLKRVGWIDKMMNKDDLNEQTRAAMERVAANYLKHGGSEDDKARLRAEYAAKTQGIEKTFYGRQLAKKLAAQLKEVDAKRAFVKEVLRDKLNKQIARDKLGKTEEELEAMRENARRELKDMEEKYREELKNTSSLAGKDMAALRDGLVDCDGNSILEARIRAEALGALAVDGADSSKSTSPLQFGATLEDSIGLQVSNIGLSVGKPFLGVDGEQQDKARNSALIAIRSAMKANAERTLGLKKYDLAQQEYAAEQLETKLAAATTPAEKAKIEADLRIALSKRDTLKQAIEHTTRQVENFEKDIDAINNAS